MAYARMLLNGDQFKLKQQKPIFNLGERLFPAFEKILRDPRSDHTHVSRAFFVLHKMQTDRQRFRQLAAERLKDSHSDVRFDAARLLQQIGTEREAPHVVPLLSDEDNSVVLQAARTLAAIGTQRELAAMDEWIKSGKGPNRGGDTMRQVKECRDELEKRPKEIPKTLTN